MSARPPPEGGDSCEASDALMPVLKRVADALDPQPIRPDELDALLKGVEDTPFTEEESERISQKVVDVLSDQDN